MIDPLMIPLAQASAACYPDNVVFDWQSKSKLAQGLHSVINGINTFALSGTLNLREWIYRDFLAAQVPVQGEPILGDVHAGFLIDANDAVSEWIVPVLASLGWPPYYLTGHSKGGGDGQIVHGKMKVLGHPPLASRFFEPPMAGGWALATYLQSDDIAWTQTFNADGRDIVTTIRSLSTFKPLPMAPLALRVPDSDDWATKHRIPAVLISLATIT